MNLRFEAYYDGQAGKPNNSEMSSLYLLEKGYKKQNSNDSLSGYSKYSVLSQIYWQDVYKDYDINLIFLRDLQNKKDLGYIELLHHIGSIDLSLQLQKKYFINKKNYPQSEKSLQLGIYYYF
ncbi:hypothetical protein PRCB_02405 [Pantoea rodasii]|uniref:Porin n=2 Tax=Pantoea rodasii TaxID=1076549 RepID=A0A2M9WHV9_9GAMM|nr:hypothetical protein HA45_22675 [Pantoea rodasii]PJZ07134.1 hypothetical protein PRCB_02405 [Pantoea rodasii]